MDIGKILARYEGSEVTITVVPGWKDITKWRDIRYKYGNSYVKIMLEAPGTRNYNDEVLATAEHHPTGVQSIYTPRNGPGVRCTRIYETRGATHGGANGENG